MKLIPILFFTIVYSMELDAQKYLQKSRNFDFKTGFDFSLTARKGERIIYYSIGMPVRIEIKDSLENTKIIRGFITSVMENAIEIGSFQEYDSSFFVLPTIEIEKIRKLSRYERQRIGWWVGGAIVYSGVIYSILPKPLGSLSYIAFIPSMAVGYLAVYYYPYTLLMDVLNEKTKKRGWEFSVRKY